MALLWMDGFEGYYGAHVMNQAYNAGSTAGFAPGRGTSMGVNLSGSGFGLIIAPKRKLTAGFALKPGAGGNANIAFGSHVRVNTGGNRIHPHNDGGFFVPGGINPGMRIHGVWRFYEHTVYIGGAGVGLYELRIDGNLIYSGVHNTQWGSDPNVYQVSTNGSGDVMDDFYLIDDLGPAPYNTPLGDVRIYPLYPNGPGDSTQWTMRPGATSNWDEVRDDTMDPRPDSDLTYVETDVVGRKDLYHYDNAGMIAPTTPIFAIATMTSAKRNSDAGPRRIQTVVKSGGVEVQGAPHQLSDTYYMEQFRLTSNPATGLPWTKAEIDAIQAGIILDA